MSPRALPGTRLSALPLPSLQKVDMGWQQDNWTLPVVLGPEPKNRGCRCCTWLVEGGPAGAHPQPRMFLLHCRGEPSGGLWPGGMWGERAQGKAGEALRLLGAWPSGSAHSCWRRPPGWLCLLVAMVPVGGCVTSKPGSRQTVACGLKGPGGQPLWAASPTPEGEVHGVLCSPGTASHSLPRELARPSPSSGDFH